MLKFNAIAFYEAMGNLGAIQGVLMTTSELSEQLSKELAPILGGKVPPVGNKAKPESRQIGQEVVKLAHTHLDRLHNELSALGAPLTALAVQRPIAKLLNEKAPDQQTFGNAVWEITSRLRDELSLVCTLVISQEKAKYFEPKQPLFGQLVNDKLPLAVPDIEDAGKCLAVNQGTAAVFHLMRVMEAALKSLGTMLGIPYAPSWESYIKQINDKIGAKHQVKDIDWKRDEAFYRDIAGDLQTIKIVWRNPTMHIARRYSAEEAEEILRAVRGFLRRLAPKLPLPTISQEPHE
jgi:hypothetical protein